MQKRNKIIFHAVAGLVVTLITLFISSSLSANDASHPTVYYQDYSSHRNELYIYSGYGDTSSYEIHQELEGQLKKLNPAIVEIDDMMAVDEQKNADFRVVYIIVDSMDDEESIKNSKIDPALPANKYEKDRDAVPLSFTSPWMKGVLYQKQGKIVGGSIKILISSFQQIKYFYHIRKNQWNKVPDFADSNLREYVSTIEDFNKAIKLFYDKYGKNYDRQNSPPFDEIEEYFAPYGEVILLYGQIARLEGVGHSGLGSRCVVCKTTENCEDKSQIYHNKFYAHLLEKLFSKSFLMPKAPTGVVDITPSIEEQQQLYKNLGGEESNCFVTKK